MIKKDGHREGSYIRQVEGLESVCVVRPAMECGSEINLENVLTK